MTKHDEARQRLEQQRAELQQRITGIQRAERDETAQGETDNAHEWENADVREDLAREASSELEAVQAALARIDDGTYGTCTSCGKPIDGKRLEALPEAVLCTVCAERSG